MLGSLSGSLDDRQGGIRRDGYFVDGCFTVLSLFTSVRETELSPNRITMYRDVVCNASGAEVFPHAKRNLSGVRRGPVGVCIFPGSVADDRG